ncbi:hypothetical protein HX836_23715 [Pseudomonas yamanorum]|uniref:Uncharacterized protein n=1 Tax=Pseudomonas yamanorum TaxID=515393 RepID=A0A7Y8ECZ7_9PSED|nr:hypothetical protein [Pseudomonas yamanorum]NWE12388.1 hypothetical protein [Pseudomonas yamanorum]NWE77341.1 hypothetical protein [Pseudomonas yamanorum]
MTAHSILRHNGVPLVKADCVPPMFGFVRRR